MSKRTAARWYVGAWLVAVSCAAVLLLTGRGATRPSPVLELMIVACGFVMFATWIAALIQLAEHRAWRWFLGMLLVHVLSIGALGIFPMLGYAVAGPGGEAALVAVRPSTT